MVESITPVEVRGSGTGLGMAAGGITGALLGNQIGRCSGNTVATIAGAAGGAFAGNEIEKNMKKSPRYQVRVRMTDGTYRTTYQSHPPAFAVGDKVKVVNGQSFRWAEAGRVEPPALVCGRQENCAPKRREFL